MEVIIMKKRIFSILLVVVMTMALVACGTKAPSSPVNETVEAVSESSEATSVPDSEAVEATSEPEQATEAPVDEVVENTESVSETESAESASTPETSTEVLPDSEAVESEASEPEPTVPEFTVTELTATKYATQSVNVRSGPSTDYDKIGGLTTNQEVQVTGQASTGWYRFIWTDGREAYVSDKYLSDSKVEKPAASETPSNGGNSTAGTGSTASGNYEKNVWYDMGDYFFIMCNSEEESDNYYMSCFDNHDDYNIRATLKSRYPDRNTIVDGGRFIVRVSALHKTAEGFPNWDEIKYAPEVIAELHR